MADKITGFLEVGADQSTNEVVVNIPKTNETDASHICFSPSQARALAAKLIKFADELDNARGRGLN